VVLFFLVAVIVRLIKKMIDPLEEGDGKYKEGQEEAKKKGEESALDFDEMAKKAPVVADDDPMGVKIAKKL
jgi:hypothetical protein